jgi:hypothetical protein
MANNHYTDQEITFEDLKRLKNEFSFDEHEKLLIDSTKNGFSLKVVLETELIRYNGDRKKNIENNYPTNVLFDDYLIENLHKIAEKHKLSLIEQNDTGNEKKVKEFNELMEKDSYYKAIYLYLLKFEDEFIYLSLKDFILNCAIATYQVTMQLARHKHTKDISIEFINEQKEFYDEKNSLTNFELYLTKFIVAHNIYKVYDEDFNRTVFFEKAWNNCKMLNSKFKYSIKYSDNIQIEKMNSLDWELVLNKYQHEPSNKWKDLIKNELQDRLTEIENKIPNKITNWKQRIDLIECAGFCQLLFDKKYFVQGSTIIKSVNSFALSRYGTDIDIQLKAAKKESRERHKKLLNVYFK